MYPRYRGYSGQPYKKVIKQFPDEKYVYVKEIKSGKPCIC